MKTTDARPRALPTEPNSHPGLGSPIGPGFEETKHLRDGEERKGAAKPSLLRSSQTLAMAGPLASDSVQSSAFAVSLDVGSCVWKFSGSRQTWLEASLA